MSLYRFSINHASQKDIEVHLNNVSPFFLPPLNTYTNIPVYAKKIKDYASTFEAWFNDELIGLIACYLNNYESYEGFITNVSIIKEHYGKGVASQLMNSLLKETINKGFKSLSLEVAEDNEEAIKLYKKYGFITTDRNANRFRMEKSIKVVEDIYVSISCITFNQAPFIRETIEGFLMQVFDKPFEVLIYDDASIDGTDAIIKEYESKYPNIVKPIYQTENQYSKGVKNSPMFNWPRAKGNYIILCEGDDYWTDPFKLQKQVDFLEANPEYAMVATDVILVNTEGEVIPDTELLTKQRENRKPDVTVFDLLNVNLINTLTVCVRADVLKELAKESLEKEYWFVVDKWYWLNIALNHKVKLFYEKTAAYRIHDEGISRKEGFLKPRMDLIHFDVVQKIYRNPKYSQIDKNNRAILAKTYYKLFLSTHLKLSNKLTLAGYLIAKPNLLFSYVSYIFTLVGRKFKREQNKNNISQEVE